MENKKELFSFISAQISKTDLGGKLLLSARFEAVTSNRRRDLATLQPCNHFDVDIRILRYLAQSAEQGHTTAYVVRTADSDVVVFAVRFIKTLGLSSCIWPSQQSRVIQQPVLFARRTAMSWFWQCGFSRLSAYPSFRSASVAERITVTFQSIPSTPISVRQSP